MKKIILCLLLVLTVACEGPIGPQGPRGSPGTSADIDSREFVLTSDGTEADWIIKITNRNNYFAEVWIRQVPDDAWGKLTYGFSYYQSGSYVIIFYNPAYVNYYCKVVFLENFPELD